MTYVTEIDDSVDPVEQSSPMPDPQVLNYGDGSGFLFGRRYEFTVGTPGDPEAVVYSDNKIVFDIEKCSESTSNKAKVDLWNVNVEQNVSNMKNMSVQLKVGYGTDLISIFFGVVGTVNRCYRTRKGPDIVTTFELGDSERALYGTYLQKTWPANVPIINVLKDLVSELSLTSPVIDPAAATDLTWKLQSPLAVNGSVKAAIDNIVSNAKLVWSIYDGVVTIWKSMSGFSGIKAIRLSKFTGLIGIPTTKSIGNDGIVTAVSLLNPRLKPGAIVYLESEAVSTAAYVVQKATYSGDSHSNKWQVTLEMMLLPTVGVPLQ